MKNIFKIKTGISIFFLLIINACKLDIINPNAPTENQVLNSRDGIIELSIGLRQHYSTSCITDSYFYPAVTSREISGTATFINTIELEKGGTFLSTSNGNILTLWSDLQKLMKMSEDILNNVENISAIKGGTLSGIIAHAKLYKAIALGALIASFEQANINTNKNGKAVFYPRAIVLAEAIKLLKEAIDQIKATPVSEEFTKKVLGTDFSLINCLYAFNARYNLMAGNYTAAITNANAVNLTIKSQFNYTTQSVNPLWNTSTQLKYYTPRAKLGLPASLFIAGDAREAFYITTTETTIILKGFSVGQTSPVPVYIPDEMKLIKAEAILRNDGSASDALALINEVRTQTTGDPFGVNAALPAYSGKVTKEDLLTEIYVQRCAELFLSGLRLEDSRRFGRPGPLSEKDVERNRNFYPYPDQERIANPNTPDDPKI